MTDTFWQIYSWVVPFLWIAAAWLGVYLMQRLSAALEERAK